MSCFVGNICGGSVSMGCECVCSSGLVEGVGCVSLGNLGMLVYTYVM